MKRQTSRKQTRNKNVILSPTRQIQDDYLLQPPQRTKGNGNDDEPNLFKQFEEHSIHGLEASLSISMQNEELFQLLESKNNKKLQQGSISSSNSRVSHLKGTVSSQNVQDMSSFSTSSFGNRTMKLTLNNSPSHMGNIEGSIANVSPRNLQQLKPSEMGKLQMTYGDSDMKILVEKEGLKKAQSVQYKELKEVREENEEEPKKRKQKGQNNEKNQQLLDNLECVRVDSEHSKNLQESSFQEPFFHEPSMTEPVPFSNLSNQQIDGKEKTGNVLGQNSNKRSSQTSIASTAASKKLTLKDYLNLNKISSKKKYTEGQSTRTFVSEQKQTCCSPMKMTEASRKRKVAASNRELQTAIHKEICSDIRSIQQNLAIILQDLEREEDLGIDQEPSEEEIMKFYNINLLLKEKIIKGSQDVKNMMKNSKKGLKE